MNESNSKRPTPPYVSFKTFTNFLNSLKESGLPSQIDRSMLKGMSGSAQSAILLALEYLYLISKSGNAEAKLQELVDSDEETREPVLRDVITASYPFLFNGVIDLKRATTKQVEDEFRKQGVSGSTVVKCMAFFLAAAKAAGIPVSPHVKTPTVTRPPKRTQSGSSPGGQEFQEEEEEESFGSPNKHRLKLPLPGKDDVVVVLPVDFSENDWAFLQPILNSYVGQIIKAK